MRHSLPIALALTAFTVVGACGTASAGNYNSNPWTAPLFTNAPTKPPKANTNQNPSATQTTVNPQKGKTGPGWQHPRGNTALQQD
jgi:hypothetical protein